MAYVVRRRSGRFEIRESVMTPVGPRARSLAAFRVLSDGVLDRAARLAAKPFDRDRLVAAARRTGAPVEGSAADGAAISLLAELTAGRAPVPGLRRLLIDELERAGPVPDLPGLGGADAVASWTAASPEQRGEALRDLLGLGDRLPVPKRSHLRFPGLRPLGEAVG